MAGVAVIAPDIIIARFHGVFTLLEVGANMIHQAQIEILVSLPLGERPPLVVCLDSPEPHI